MGKFPTLLKRSNTALLLAFLALTAVSCGSESGAPVLPPAAAGLPAGSIERLADQADPHTLYVTANDYATGSGVAADQEIAERLWQVACEKGHADSCSTLGSRKIGAGDLPAAERALLQAAESGNLAAIRNLIVIYRDQSWSGTDTAEAERWGTILQELDNPAPAQSPVELPDELPLLPNPGT